MSNRSDEDELMLRLIGNPRTREFYKDQPKNLHIYDARPYINAYANRLNGKGYELTDHYKNAEIFFMDIDNIHHVKECHRKILTLSEKYYITLHDFNNN